MQRTSSLMTKFVITKLHDLSFILIIFNDILNSSVIRDICRTSLRALGDSATMTTICVIQLSDVVFRHLAIAALQQRNNLKARS